MDPRQQLLVDEGPRQAIVRPGKRAHPGRRIRAAEHDHRAVGHDTAVERLRVPEHEYVGIRRAGQLLGALTRDDVEAVVAELALEEAADCRFGLGEEQRGHGTRLGAAPRLRQMSFRTKGWRRIYSRPERTTPQRSQNPRTAESAKPTTERIFTPRTCGPAVAKIPMMLEPISPPTTMSAITSRLKATSSFPMNSSSPLCLKRTSIWPSRISSMKSWNWYGASARTCA